MRPLETHVVALFHPLIRSKSHCTLDDLTPVGQVLNMAIRSTLLPEASFARVSTNIQQWLFGALVSHIVFDIVDFLLCEIEDVISNGFHGRCQFPYTHYLSHMFMKK